MNNLVSLLGKEVDVVIDRPFGSRHPKYPNILYLVNYGYVPNIIAGDNEYQDVYVLGVNEPLKTFRGVVIAIIHRLNDVENKLVVAPKGMNFSNDEIEALVHFQEQYFKHELIRQ